MLMFVLRMKKVLRIKSWTKTFCSAIFLLPSFFLALLPVYSISGDNKIYEFGYASIAVNDVANSFLAYSSAVAGSLSEPIIFAFFYFFKAFALPYDASIIALNVLLLYSLCLAISTALKRLSSVCLASFFCGSSYYLFLCFAELHKLSLGLSIFLICASVSSSKLVPLISVFAHPQTLLMYPFRFIHERLGVRQFRLCITIIAIFAIVSAPFLWSKILIYRQQPMGELSQTIFLFMGLTTQLMFFARSRLRIFILGLMPTLCISSLIGGGRTNFVIFFVYSIIMFLKFDSRPDLSPANLIFLATLILFTADGISKYLNYFAL